MLQEHVSHKNIAEVRKPLIFWNALLEGKGLVAYLPIIVVVILMFCGASWQFFWLYTDAARYQCYAMIFWLGSHGVALLPSAQCSFLHLAGSMHPPLHTLPLEYPPLTLVLFSLALLAPLPYYQFMFALLMALTAVFIYWLLLRYGPRGSALAFAFYALVGTWATAEGRFDLVPAALTLLCLIAARHKHWTAAYVVLAFGVLFKIYPILLLPALFIAEQQSVRLLALPTNSMTLRSIPSELWHSLRGMRSWRWRNVLLFFGVLIATTGIFALIDFQGAVVSQLSYFANRPVQVEATGSIFLWLATLIGYPIHIVYSYGSINIISALDKRVSFVWDVLFVLGYVYAIWLQWRGKLEITQASIAILLIFIATGKVFSPQYLIWLMPLLAYNGAFDVFWLLYWGAISLLTTIIYPYLYTRTPDALKAPFVPGFVPTVTARDVLFVLLTLAYLFNWFRIRQSKSSKDLTTEKEVKSLYAE